MSNQQKTSSVAAQIKRLPVKYGARHVIFVNNAQMQFMCFDTKAVRALLNNSVTHIKLAESAIAHKNRFDAGNVNLRHLPSTEGADFVYKSLLRAVALISEKMIQDGYAVDDVIKAANQVIQGSDSALIVFMNYDQTAAKEIRSLVRSLAPIL